MVVTSHLPSGIRPSATQPGRPVALVTGASRGLGFLLARELADHGHDLVISARSETGLSEAASALRARGGKVSAVTGDVSARADAERMINAVREGHGRLDVLVANAGIIQVGPLSALTERDFAQAMDVMYWGVVRPTLAALPMLKERAGRILVVTSVGGKVPAPHLLPYVAAKHAAVGFAEGLRVELAAEGVSVTVAVPGLMRTGSPRNALFAGPRESEFRWFAAVGGLPLLSISAERAARALIRAARRRKPEVVLTPAARLGVLLHGVAPSTTLRALSVANRLLSSGAEAGPPAPGWQIASPGRWFRAVTTLNRRAADRYHQHHDPVAPISRRTGPTAGDPARPNPPAAG